MPKGVLRGRTWRGPSGRMYRCVAGDPQKLQVKECFPRGTLVGEYGKIGYRVAWIVDRRNGYVRFQHGDVRDM